MQENKIRVEHIPLEGADSQQLQLSKINLLLCHRPTPPPPLKRKLWK